MKPTSSARPPGPGLRGLAYKRHQSERWRKRVRRYWICEDYDNAMVITIRGEVRQRRVRGPYPTRDARRLGMAVRTRKPCSRYCCGSPRKWFGEITVQERKAPRPEEWDDE